MYNSDMTPALKLLLMLINALIGRMPPGPVPVIIVPFVVRPLIIPVLFTVCRSIEMSIASFPIVINKHISPIGNITAAARFVI